MRSSRIRLWAAAIGALFVSSARAAPPVGPPFFVADPLTAGEAAPAVAAAASGYVVAWVAEKELAYRYLDSDGALGGAGSVLARPSGVSQPSYNSVTYPGVPVELASLGAVRGPPPLSSWGRRGCSRCRSASRRAAPDGLPCSGASAELVR